MKMLVCVDGSAQSMKAVDKAAEIASGCQINEVSLIHVYEPIPLTYIEYVNASQYKEQTERIDELNRQLVADRREMLQKAAASFKDKGIEPDMILEEGHPSHTIAQLAEEKKFDMIVMGNRGIGGLKKLILGSVSNAVIQESHTSVLVVK